MAAPDPSSEPKRRLQEQGYFIHRGVFDAALMREAESHVEALRRANPDVASDRFGYVRLKADPFWARLAADDRLTDRAAASLGKDVLLADMFVLGKPPRRGMPVAWHQDAYDFRAYLDPVEVVQLWVAFEDSSAENGGLRVIPGSHRSEVVRPHGRPSPPFYPRQTALQDPVDETLALDLDLRSGDVAEYGPFLLHGSYENKSGRTRNSGVFCYISPAVKSTFSIPPVLVRGERRGL